VNLDRNFYKNFAAAYGTCCIPAAGFLLITGQISFWFTILFPACALMYAVQEQSRRARASSPEGEA
jgi:hypothetical protein